jgi:RNA polymerase sigma factor (TIGR02999 family)
LVNEVCLRLYGQRKVSWENRRQFFAFASKLMRRILIDYSRTRKAVKRGWQLERVSISDAPDVGDIPPLDPDQLLDLSRALDRLEEQDSRTAEIVGLRFFTGLSVEECAAALDVGTATVKRDWAFARHWLARELGSPAYRDDPRPDDLSPSDRGVFP